MDVSEELPGMYILRASEEFDSARYVICLTNFNKKRDAWNSVILENPRFLFKEFVWKEGEELAPRQFRHERVSVEYGITYYTSTMARTKYYLDIPEIGNRKVYKYTMTRPNTILPAEFYRVFNNEDIDMKWHFVDAENPAGEFKIPSHVKEGYIEWALMKKESCPISLDILVRGQVVCTPCGHLFSRGSVEGIHVCPVCRKKI
jgi:hypothetical protein